MSGNRVKTDALNTVYTSEVYPLGTTFEEHPDEVATNNSGAGAAGSTYSLLQGSRTWVFIQCVAPVNAGDLVKRNAVTTPFVGAQDNTNEGTKWLMLGVADHAIAAPNYGWIIKKGPCVVQAEAGVAAGDLLASDGNTTVGEVDTWTGGAGLSHKIVGIALEAEDASSAGGAGFVQAIIDIP